MSYDTLWLQVVSASGQQRYLCFLYRRASTWQVKIIK